TVQHFVLTSRYDVGGHAAGHLASASAPFMSSVVVCMLLWTTPAVRRRVDLVCAAALWLAMTVLIAVGNVRVVNDLIDAGYSRTATSAIPDIADHALANSSTWLAEGAALILIAAWYRRRLIGVRATVAAVLITLIVPPWIIPGAGVIVVALMRLVQHGRAFTSAAVSRAPESVDSQREKVGRG
ncbi:MAG TPA: hypothetical protein VIH06_11820, partial [Ilumatobacteraceae bacterium]